jgi:hypothetical protein
MVAGSLNRQHLMVATTLLKWHGSSLANDCFELWTLFPAQILQSLEDSHVICQLYSCQNIEAIH